MRHAPLLGAAASLCIVLVVAACGGGGGDKSEAEVKEDLSATLQSGDDGFNEETADCFAEIVIDEVGVTKLRDVDLSADEPPKELDDEIATAAVRAAEECDLSGLGG